MVSLTIITKTTPTTRVAIRESMASALHSISAFPRSRIGFTVGRAPEKVADRQSNDDRDRECPAREGFHARAHDVCDRLVSGQQCPGLIDQQRQDAADEDSDPEGEPERDPQVEPLAGSFPHHAQLSCPQLGYA